MSEADLVMIGFIGIQTRMIIWTTEFTLIFGYLAALYFFLRHTAFPFRLFAFTMFVLLIFFFWSGFAGTDVAFARYIEARSALIAEGRLPAYWTDESSRNIRTLIAIASVLGNLLHTVAVTGGLYLTFFYRWRTRGARRV